MALADIFYANGADRSLMEVLSATINLLNLRAYAGWNTAGNSIGTVLAQGAIVDLSSTGKAAEERINQAAQAQVTLLTERLADDWLYQSKVRQEASAKAIVQHVSMFHLDAKIEEFHQFIQDNMKEKVKEFFDDCIPCKFRFKIGKCTRNYKVSGPGKVHVTLPWDRLFEVNVSLNVKLEEIT